MKKVQYVSFLTIVLTIYSLVNLYIFVRGWQAMPHGTFRVCYVIVFLFVASCFITGRILERRFAVSGLTDILIWIGSFWLAAMLYFVLVLIVIDLARLVNFIAPYYPSFITRDYPRAKFMTSLIATSVVALVVLAGYINAITPRLRTYDIHIPKVVDGPKSVTIAAATDIHLGTMVGASRLEHLVAMVDSLHPDLILLPGDIVDEDIGAHLRNNLGDLLRNLKAPLGVYAVTGNHEFYSGVERACAFLTDHNVTMLRDTAIRVNGFYLVGREDRSKRGFGPGRKTLPELMALVDPKLPIIMMDHQPFELEKVAEAGVDLQISGHTHNGQLWPFNYITDRVYELSWGYKKIGNTNFYVSCGYGTWGPPVRSGNRPEVIAFRLTFD